jgi:hypothetical protein
MRPLTLILVFGGMVALLMFGVLRRHRVEHSEPYFFNRAIVAPGLYRRLWPKELPDEVEKEHQAVSDRVLLIRTPAIVDHADFSNQQGSVAHQPWNFADVIQRAFKIGGAPHPAAQSLADSLRAALSNATYFPGAVNHNFARAWADADPLFSLAKAPVRLLAIINRIDLARTQDIYANCPADKPFGGAELRFIYSARTATDDEHYLSLIVEFVLPCKTAAELQSIGNEWWPLKDMDPSSPKYRATLEGILDRRTIESGQVRLRVNGKATNSWNTREFGFTASGISPQDLARQYSAEVQLGVCQDSSQLLGKYVHANLPGVNDSNYTYGSGDPLATKTATIADPDESFHAVLTLGENLTDSSNQTLSGKAADDARYSLSLNACNACHGPETGVIFHQVSQRQPTRPSDLSGFLTGATDGAPSGSTGLLTAKTPTNISQLSNCAALAKPQSRQFNDLLRRHVFLYYLRNPPRRRRNDNLLDLLAPFTAYQVE